MSRTAVPELALNVSLQKMMEPREPRMGRFLVLTAS